MAHRISSRIEVLTEAEACARIDAAFAEAAQRIQKIADRLKK